MSDKIDWNSTAFDERIGCLGVFLLVPSAVIGFASSTYVIRLVWGWYPPFGIEPPSFMHVAGLMFLVAMVRGYPKSEGYRWTNHKWFEATLRPVLLPWMMLGTFLLLRWLAS